MDDGDAFDTPEWREGFARRAKEMRDEIFEMACNLSDGVITRDVPAIRRDESTLFEALYDLEDILSLSDPDRACAIASIAHDLLWCGYALGRRCEPHTEIAHIARQDTAELARAARAKKGAPRLTQLREAVLAGANGANLEDTWPFAESIRLDVWKSLEGMGSPWKPDTKTIRRRISAILLERR